MVTDHYNKVNIKIVTEFWGGFLVHIVMVILYYTKYVIVLCLKYALTLNKKYIIVKNC